MLVALVVESTETSACEVPAPCKKGPGPFVYCSRHAVVVESAESVPQAHLARVPEDHTPPLRELPASSPVPAVVPLIASVAALGGAVLLARRRRLLVVVP